MSRRTKAPLRHRPLGQVFLFGQQFLLLLFFPTSRRLSGCPDSTNSSPLYPLAIVSAIVTQFTTLPCTWSTRQQTSSTTRPPPRAPTTGPFSSAQPAEPNPFSLPPTTTQDKTAALRKHLHQGKLTSGPSSHRVVPPSLPARPVVQNPRHMKWWLLPAPRSIFPPSEVDLQIPPPWPDPAPRQGFFGPAAINRWLFYRGHFAVWPDAFRLCVAGHPKLPNVSPDISLSSTVGGRACP